MYYWFKLWITFPLSSVKNIILFIFFSPQSEMIFMISFCMTLSTITPLTNNYQHIMLSTEITVKNAYRRSCFRACAMHSDFFVLFILKYTSNFEIVLNCQIHFLKQKCFLQTLNIYKIFGNYLFMFCLSSSFYVLRTLYVLTAIIFINYRMK